MRYQPLSSKTLRLLKDSPPYIRTSGCEPRSGSRVGPLGLKANRVESRLGSVIQHRLVLSCLYLLAITNQALRRLCNLVPRGLV